MMLYRNTKVKVRSLYGNTDYFDILAGVLLGETLAPYADDIALLAETLQHSLERAAAGIGLHVNTDKTEYMCFN